MSEDEIAEGMVSQAMSQEEAGPPSEEEVILGQLEHLLRDELVIKMIIEKKPEYMPVFFTLSHLNRTSNIDQQTAKELMARFKRQLHEILMTKKEKDITMGEQAFIDGLINFAKCAIADAVQGHRARIVTEIRRIFRIERGQSASRRPWFW